MKCPNCNNEMEVKNLGNVEVDVCSNCGGMWFDWMELIKLDEPNEGFGKNLEELLRQPLASDKNRPDLKCPKCNITMRRHAYKFSKEVEIDECYQCGGIFLDRGELKLIRETHLTEEEREKLAENLLKNTARTVYGSGLPESFKKLFGME